MKCSAEQYKERMDTLREKYKVLSFIISIVILTNQSTGHEAPVDVLLQRDMEDPDVDLQGAGHQ